MLRVRYVAPGKLTTKQCRRLWTVRLQNVNLRAEVDREADYRAFESYFLDDTLTVTFWSRDSELQGFFGWNTKRTTVAGKDFVRVLAEYAFLNPAYRGNLAFSSSIVRLGTRTVLAHSRTRCVIVGLAYPSSYLSLRRIGIQMRTLKSPLVTHDEQRLLEEFAHEYGGEGFDPQSGIVRMRTTPVVPSRASTRASVCAALAEYEARNPRWREGYCLPILVHANFRACARAALGATTRALGLS